MTEAQGEKYGLGIPTGPKNGLSLCGGGGGLDMGLCLAEPEFRTLCWVEIEDYPRSTIIAGQRAGYLHPAPIWDDVTTFDARPWRGVIDTVLAGYPCQPFSQAGQRKGADDDRHLWPEVARIILECQPRWVFLENVAGHVTLGGEAVLRELWDMGWPPAAGLFSASETGAPHERLRWFCVAYRDRPERGANIGEPNARADWRHDATGGSGTLVADASVGRRAGSDEGQDQQPWRAEVERTGEDVDNAASPRCDAARIGAGADIQGRERLSGDGCAEMGNPAGIVRREGRAEHGVRSGRNAVTSSGSEVADASQPGSQGREQPGSSDQRHRAPAYGPTAELRRLPLFPPSPSTDNHAAWRAVLDHSPDLAPAVSLGCIKRAADNFAAMVAREELAETAAEYRVRRMAHGMASRTRSLRLLGNGVVPLAAGYAWRALADAHGLRPVDLATAGGCAGNDATGTVLRAAE